MSTIHCRLDVLASSAFCIDGRATFNDEFPATMITRLMQRTPRVHQRRSYAAVSPAGTATPSSSRSIRPQALSRTFLLRTRHLSPMRNEADVLGQPGAGSARHARN